MLLSEVATVRTGLVTTRKKVKEDDACIKQYRMLNLKCIDDAGYIHEPLIEVYESSEHLKSEYFTHMNDVLMRLSAPYTTTIIKKVEQCNLLIPSHFAIIRSNNHKAVSEYIYWCLNREKIKIHIMQNSSGSTSFGTISSGLIRKIRIRDLPLDSQKVIGELMLLSNREQELLYQLASEKRKHNKFIINQIYDTLKKRK